MGTISRATILLTTELVIVQTFALIAKSGVNPGVISIIYSSSSIVFTSVIFYFKHGQKLTKWDLLGTLFIIASIIMIGLSGVKDDENSE